MTLDFDRIDESTGRDSDFCTSFEAMRRSPSYFAATARFDVKDEPPLSTSLNFAGGVYGPEG